MSGECKVFHHPVAPASWQGDFEEYRAVFCIRWSRLVKAAFVAPERCAVEMGVGYQTAVNWFSGAHRPTGDKVALLSLMYPDLFARIMGGGQ